MTAERPTFSPLWHRVRAMRPRLRPHTQIVRQFYRGRRWHVVQDPASNQFFRLDPISYELVAMLDGARTIEEIWRALLTRHADAAPTQPDVVQLLAQLYGSNLLAAEGSPEAEQLLRRGRERLKKKAVQKALGVMYFKIRLFNPDAILEWVEPILRPILNRWGLLAWAALVAAALWQIAPHLSRLWRGVPDALQAANWGWLLLGYVVLKAFHELGHGVLCRRFGGQVPEFGAMLLVLMPSPYVDASACWAFPEKWRRIAVGAGGIVFELAIAAAAVFVWLRADEGTLVSQLAFNAILTAGVSTVLFNANPLMRFDGYYVLSDLLEVPNLMQRSSRMLQHLFQRHVYRIKDARPPTTQPGERAILLVFGVLALAYRVALFVTVTLLVMGKFFALGLVLAVWTAAAWFLVPAGAFVHWLASSPQLAEHRFRAVAVSLLLVAAVGGLVGLTPMPDRRRAEGVIESERVAGLFVGAPGVVVEAHARPGDRLVGGDPILTLRSPELETQLALAQAQLAEERVREREWAVENPAAAQVGAGRVDAAQRQVEQLRARLDRLVVRAPFDGVLVGDDPARLVGSFAAEGRPIADFVDERALRVAVGMTQPQAGWLFQVPRERFGVHMRRVADPHRTLAGGRVFAVDAGQRRLPHAALSLQGGGSALTDPSDRSGLRVRTPVFTVYVEPEAGGLPGMPGERVAVRFTLPPRPLLAQWTDRLLKAIPDVDL